MPKLSRVPDIGAEVLRLLLVVFGAAVGFEIGSRVQQDDPSLLLGVFDAMTVGVIVGAGLGFSLGGVIARRIMRGISAVKIDCRRCLPTRSSPDSSVP